MLVQDCIQENKKWEIFNYHPLEIHTSKRKIEIYQVQRGI